MTVNQFYFAQHGLAVDKTVDPDRPLSETGRSQTHDIANCLFAAAIPVTQVFHSGKLRASQTAEIFASTLDVNSVTAIENLSPNDDIKLIAQHLTINHALYVGHLPHLEKLIAHLIADDQYHTIIKFQNSGVACVEETDNHYQLRWHVTPEVTRRQNLFP